MSNDPQFLDGKSILVTGGTGSLGKVVVRRLLSGSVGTPERVIVLSRDEGKHHEMRLQFMRLNRSATDDAAYHNFERALSFVVGDVRDYATVAKAVHDVHYVIHAAALKQVPSCEYFPIEAVRTNIDGAHNVARSIREHGRSVERAVAISTDKACKPVNVMGMTKAIQERIFVEANLGQDRTVFAIVRYGNVIASRGSVVPLFQSQIAQGGPVTVTVEEMTRFLLTLDQAVDAVLTTLRTAEAGETYIPIVPAVRVVDLARAMIGERDIRIEFTGIRPGEKVHEILVSEEEVHRTTRRHGHYVIGSMLPEVAGASIPSPALTAEYSSSATRMTDVELNALLSTASEGHD